MATRTTSKTNKAAPKEEPEGNVWGEKEDGALSGNLTEDPTLRFTQSGRAVANLRIASSEREKNDEGQWVDTPPEFYTVTVWGQQAEHAVECLTKGDRMVATGWFQDRTYTDKDGDRITVTEFTAKDIGPSLLFRNAVITRLKRGK